MAATFDPVKVCEDLASLQDKILDIVDELEEIQLAAEASSGQIKQVLPNNIMTAMDKLTAIVDGSSPDSLTQLADYIGNLPLKALQDVKKTKRSELRKQAAAAQEEAGEEFEESDLTPDTGDGPQSEIVQENALSTFLKGSLAQKKITERKLGGLSYDTLRETGLGGTIDGDLMKAFDSQAGRSATMPASAIPSGSKIRERITSKFAEEGEGLTAGAGRLEEANILNFKNPGSSLGMPGLSLGEMQA